VIRLSENILAQSITMAFVAASNNVNFEMGTDIVTRFVEIAKK